MEPVLSDLAELQRLIGLGATQQAEVKEGGYHWYTLTDPQGNEFDIVSAAA